MSLGLVRPDAGGPAHADLAASPGGRASCGRSPDLDDPEPACRPAHQPLVHASALRRSAGEDRRSGRFEGVRLAALAFRADGTGEAAPIADRRALSARGGRSGLASPAPGVAVADVARDGGAVAHAQRVRAPAHPVRAGRAPRWAVAGIFPTGASV